MKRIQFLTTTILSFILLLCLPASAPAEEGMYPISEISKLDLPAKGLEISPQEIFNPEGASLIDGIVKVNGCSGSFVSPEGLILTNHHCAFGAIQNASSTENDYLADGFLAKTRAEEIPAKGYTVRITESYRDVSAEVLAAAKGIGDPAARTRAIDKKIKAIIKAEEAAHPGKRAEVSEMFAGKSYLLFIYTYLKDVRLVYAPPLSIGEFGGEIDNWEWPRHTGDFSFMRAYAAPDGSPAEYSPENRPFQPAKYIPVAPEGVNEGDFVFILGYPGKTYRHQTSHFLTYDREFQLPYIVKLYDWQINVMEEMGEKDRAVALKHADRVKSRTNVLKRSRGKLQGFQRLPILERKREEEKALQAFIAAERERQKMYGSVLEEIGKVYKELREQAEYEFALEYLPKSVILFEVAKTVYEAALALQKEDIDREPAFMERNFAKTREGLFLKLHDYYEPSDRVFLKERLQRLTELPQGREIPVIAELARDANPGAAIDRFIESLYAGSRLGDAAFVQQALEKSPEALRALNDSFLRFAVEMDSAFRELTETRRRREGALAELSAKLIEVKQQLLGSEFIPDANSTLRLTYGRVRGYSPGDAVTMSPITTLKGIAEKTTGEEPFDAPRKLLELHRAGDYGRFKHPQLGDVPVAILYNTDTTGGNSGSAILNARGQLVGVNFDRVFQATVNDYAWSEEYSRSIGVDIRYVLWVAQKFAGADHLLEEMKVF